MKRIILIYSIVIFSFLLCSSINFDGTDDRIVIQHSTDFEIGTGDFTISCWFYKQIGAIKGDIFNKKSSDGTDDFGLIVQSDSTFKVYLTIDGSGGLTITSVTKILPDKWYHVAVTRDNSSNMKLFINGTLDNTGTNGGNLSNNVADIWIGSNHDASFTPIAPFDGYIDEFAFWKNELDSITIKLLSNSRLRRIPLMLQDSLILYLEMGNKKNGVSMDGQTIFDISGKGNSGTGNDGANNSGLTGKSGYLTYP